MWGQLIFIFDTKPIVVLLYAIKLSAFDWGRYNIMYRVNIGNQEYDYVIYFKDLNISERHIIY